MKINGKRMTDIPSKAPTEGCDCPVCRGAGSVPILGTDLKKLFAQGAGEEGSARPTSESGALGAQDMIDYAEGTHEYTEQIASYLARTMAEVSQTMCEFVERLQANRRVLRARAGLPPLPELGQPQPDDERSFEALLRIYRDNQATRPAAESSDAKNNPASEGGSVAG
jgi:hypothetical protein